MKIIQFITHMNERGGAQNHVLELSKAMHQEGHEVIVMSSGNSEIVTQLEKEGIQYVPISSLITPINIIKDISSLYKIRKKMRVLAPDLVAIHSSKAGILGRIAAYSLNIPTVFTAHSWSFSPFNNFFKRKLFLFLEKYIAKITNGIITVSYNDYLIGLKHNIINKKATRVIHNGIEDVRFCRNDDVRDTLHLIMVSRFAHPKDHHLLLTALKNIEIDNWELTLVGDGPNLNVIKDYAKQLDLDKKIIFTGEKNNVIPYLEKSDVLLLISKSEGLPISIIEGMRAKLPIIASDVGGIKELIENKKQGLLVNNNVEEISNALKMLLNDNKLLKKYGDSSYEKYLEHFTFDKMYKKTINFYTYVLNKK